MKRILIVSVLSALGFTLAGCGDSESKNNSSKELSAEFQKLPKHLQDDFKAGDKNGDNKIQDSELDAMVTEDFAASDVNKDGSISASDLAEELGKDAVQGAAASLKTMDRNGDGRVTPSEYAVHISHDFLRRMDKNADGDLDPDEVAAFYGKIYDRTPK